VKLVLTVGLPGSGKSTYLANLGANAISSDEMRLLLADDVTDQTVHNQVFAAVRYLVRSRLAMGQPVTYVDATNLTRWERRPYILIARKYGSRIEALYFHTPLEVCLERNCDRDRVVPDEVIRAMAKKLQPPTREEGFDRVIKVSDMV
jgi:predicted kinase